MFKMDNFTISFKEIIEEKKLITFVENMMITDNSTELIASENLNESNFNYSVSNATFHTEDWKNAYKPILDLLLLLILLVVMLSIGCEITWQNVYSHIRRPVGICIGMFSQFVILPLAAYCILRVSGIRGLHATGVLIISCCPAGVFSSTFTYFCEGNVSLSVAMTCSSTLMAMGMMPLNIWLYGRYFESDDLVIPYAKMSLSFLTVVSPVLVGMLLKWKVPRIAAWTTKLGSYCGILFMFACIAMETVLFPNMFTGIPVKLYGIILSLPIIGMTLGYGFASLLRRDTRERKTLSIECGVQNVPLALTIITLSFPFEMQEDIVLLPWLYGFAMMTGCTVICLTYHFYRKHLQKIDQGKDTDDVTKGVPLLNDVENTGSLYHTKIGIKPSHLENGKQNTKH